MAGIKAKARAVRRVNTKGKNVKKVSARRVATATKTSLKKVAIKSRTSKVAAKRRAKPVARPAAKRIVAKKAVPRISKRYHKKRSLLPNRVVKYKEVLRPKSNFVAVNTQNEFLIRKMLASGEDSERCLLVQDVVYNLSDDLRELALKSGFNLGMEVYRNSDKTLNALERVLENAGLGKVIYYPFESNSVITSYKTKPRDGANLGANVHVFESGLISGYLSANAKKHIFVRESRCVYNGSDYCQFIASSSEDTKDTKQKASSITDLDVVIKTMGDSIDLSKCKGTSESYYMLSTEPLLQEPIFSEVSKLLYFMGRKLAGISSADTFNDKLIKVAGYLGAARAKISGGKGESMEMSMSFDSVTSVGNFIDLSTAMIAGFAKGAFNKNINIQRRLTNRRNYLVRLQLTPSVIVEK